MKEYKRAPSPHLVRLQIRRHKEKIYYLTLCETTKEEVVQFCKDLINAQKLDVFNNRNRTRIDIRDSIGAKNLGSKTVSFYGLSGEETFDLICKKLKIYTT